MLAYNIELIINLVILLVVCLLSVVVIRKIKNVNPGYRLVFLVYLIFWIPLKMLREYTGIVQKNINFDFVWLPLIAYGFVGIFIRPFSDYCSFILKSRKSILQIAIIIGIISFIPIIIKPNTLTNTIQSLGVGIGASMLGIYQLLFKEQYGKFQSFLTVSVLAIPPLIADFFSSPIQSIFKILADSNPHFYQQYLSYLWVIAIAIYSLTFILLFFVKEKRKYVGLQNLQLNKKKQFFKPYLYFSLLALLGFMVVFWRFANSSSIATLTLELFAQTNQIELKKGIASLQSYVSVVFSFFHLLGSILLGFWLNRSKTKITLFVIGISCWISFEIIIVSSQNPYIYFSAAALHGFAYGILYNLILGMVLHLFFDKSKIAPMGIYQSILAIGITTSSFVVLFLKQIIQKNTNGFIAVNIVMMGLMFCACGIFYLLNKWPTNK